MRTFKELIELDLTSIIEELKLKYNIWFMIDYEDNEVLIQSEGGKMKSHKLPKKITEKWLETKIISYLEDGTSYKNLSKEFSKLIKDAKFYSTTYGLGTHIALDTEDKIKKKLKPVFDLLDDNEIIYRLEYSKALWVYKIIISKSKTNLDKIKNIKF